MYYNVSSGQGKKDKNGSLGIAVVTAIYGGQPAKRR
jgi:hypothetical protein